MTDLVIMGLVLLALFIAYLCLTDTPVEPLKNTPDRIRKITKLWWFFAPPITKEGSKKDEWRHSPHRTATMVLLGLTIVLGVVLIGVNVATYWAASEQLENDKNIQDTTYLSAQIVNRANDINELRAKRLTALSQESYIEAGAYQSTIRSLGNDIQDLNKQILSATESRKDYQNEVDRWDYIKAIVLLSTILIFLIQLVVMFGFYLTRVKSFNTEYLLRVANAKPNSRATIEAQRAAAREQLAIYQKLVLDYAKSTRRSTLIYIGIGFILVASISIGGFIIADDNAAQQVAAAIVATAAAAVAAFMTNIVLKNFDTSASELKSLFDYPIREERVLKAQQLAEAVPISADRRKLQLAIVKHLVSELPNNVKTEEETTTTQTGETPPTAPASPVKLGENPKQGDMTGNPVPPHG